VVLARSLHEAREAVERAAPELVVLDRRLPDGDGLDYLPELKAQLPGTPVVMVTAHGDIQSAVDAIRAGASDYVAKPVDLTDLVMRAQRAMGEQNLRERLSRVEAELSGRRRLVPPRSVAMRQVLAMLERIATPPGARCSCSAPPARARRCWPGTSTRAAWARTLPSST